MKLQIRGVRNLVKEARGSTAELRVRMVLGRFGDEVDQVTLRLSEAIGPGKHPEKSCSIDAEVPNHVRVECTHVDLGVAIERAADKAMRAISRVLDQVRDGRLVRSGASSQELEVGRVLEAAQVLETARLLAASRVLETARLLKTTRSPAAARVLEAARVLAASRVLKTARVVAATRVRKTDPALEAARVLAATRVLETARVLAATHVLKTAQALKRSSSKAAAR
jgi:hypothetical protein